MFSEIVFMGQLLTLQGGSTACSVLTPVFSRRILVENVPDYYSG